MARSGRVAWIDAARGICITLVVFGHVERGLVAAKLASGPIWDWIDYGLYTFHMPLFFVLAGINVPTSLTKGRQIFLHNKLWTIAYPYVLWSFIQGAVMVALSQLTNGQTSFSDLLKIGWHPIAQFWFLYVLMVCQVLALALAARPRLFFGLSVLSFLVGTSLRQGSIVEELLHAVPFFAFGILFSERLLAKRPGAADWFWGSIAACGLAIAIPLSGQWDGMNFDAILALPASVCGIALLILMAQYLTGLALNIACLLGRTSMTIYIMHIMAAAGTRIALVKLHVAPDPWLYAIVCTIIGVVLPLIVHIVLKRLRLLGLFGLGSIQYKRQISVAHLQ